MEKRAISHIIGIVDMIFAVLGVLIGAGPALFLLQHRNSAQKDVLEVDEHILEWFSMGIVLCLYLLQIFAAWKLIKGTAQTISPVDGYRHCRIWRIITIIFIVFLLSDFIVNFVMGIHWIKRIYNLICSILHIASLALVQSYAKELEASLLTSTGSDTPVAQYYYPNAKE